MQLGGSGTPPAPNARSWTGSCTRVRQVPPTPTHNSALSNPLSGPSSAQTPNCTAETARAHIVFRFLCFVAMAEEAWKRGGGGGLDPGQYIFNRNLAPAGLKCNHASCSYCAPLPPLCSTTSITQRDMHVTVVGLHNRGWAGAGAGGVQEKQSLSCYLLVLCARPCSHNNILQNAVCQ